MNHEWLVWGFGSQAENACMYALNLSDAATVLPSDAPGHSRLSIAKDNNAVLVPISNESDAVTFRAGVLQE